ncbi:hypothetical protein Sj15T_23990 [Sphingobium sp. TA15]|uniref:Uncharacterized protein n=1 Tax=Sphingobium indicum (strain DSM 16413 / CCM 7287 / MTCC 6362 / UT26 / NBRC 101211 / UT26S) TaxID=452662 RepID=D4Z5W4_SPHIU|nr:hypothetical protein [Sphingobium indicum]BAI97996.1 hypothetical protein SJA_C1-31620 [Sphingobium indicum UT26S]BDD67378.1 hypothetical protein Sj15T_23990 [Sphingobium sp. TA15]
MDTTAADKIKLHLDALTAKALSAFKRQMLHIHAGGDYGEFVPEFMVNDMVRAAESSASQLLADAVSRVSGISTAPASFTMIDMAMNAYLSDLQGVVEQGRGVPLHPAMLKVAGERFDAVRRRLIRHLDNHRSSFVESKNKGGRPPTWDWEGALIHVTAIANTPDGLPSERGAQARIEEIIHDWFIQAGGDAPADSEIRKRASAIMKGLKTSFRPLPADTFPDS